MSDDVSVVVQDDSQFVEGLRLCLSYHIITSWDTPTSVAGRSSVIADNDGEEENLFTCLVAESVVALVVLTSYLRSPPISSDGHFLHSREQLKPVLLFPRT